MDRIKIFYFIPNLQQGGTEQQLLRLIRSLPARFEPVLCLYHDLVFYQDELIPGQPRHVLGHKRMNLAGVEELTRILREERPHILHCYRDKANFWGRLTARRAGVPIVITSSRNRFMQPHLMALERHLSDRADLILSNSESVKAELVTWARVRPEKVQVIYNILDTEFFRPPTPEERQAARAAWQLGEQQVAFLLPGRISLQKHQLGLLWSLSSLAHQRRLAPQAVFLLAGRRRDPGTARLVDWLRARPGLRDQVRFLDAQKDIRSLYWAADVLTLPSLYEGLSNAALEGCATGLPAILSRATNLDQTIVDGETGFEVPTFWPGPLADAIERMLALGPGARQAMGARGRAHVVARFGRSPTEATVAVYDRLLREKGLA
ncbi:MAG TPA: glycosyltransferase [Myxococcota bacterium]|nr:glycosyltransferase [Myxococcota bacterium]HRY96218.1 glycosyltransferase [Myxococcota bacterium]HSA22167.1 glycosyltransferase [Myxococcota bacterium]